MYNKEGEQHMTKFHLKTRGFGFSDSNLIFFFAKNQ